MEVGVPYEGKKTLFKLSHMTWDEIFQTEEKDTNLENASKTTRIATVSFFD
jgi:hypothetical protein